jgi:phosphotransferase system IIA component
MNKISLESEVTVHVDGTDGIRLVVHNATVSKGELFIEVDLKLLREDIETRVRAEIAEKMQAHINGIAEALA